MSKHSIFCLAIFLSISTVLFSQTTDDDNSLRHYLGQTRTYIINNFESCHIENNEKTLELTCGKYTYLLAFKDGLSYAITLSCPSKESVNGFLAHEIDILNKEGWKLISKTDDKGDISYVYKKDKKCVSCYYMSMLNWIAFQYCDK